MFKLRTLPYESEAFGGFLSKESFEYHHAKHHKAYVDNLNTLIKGGEFENKDLVAIILASKGAVFNNAAQIYNHDFYFDCITPQKLGFSKVSKELKNALETEFNSLESFKEAFIKGATSLFGAGWFWLVYDAKSKKLGFEATTNAATPISEGKIPLLVIDVWEHAYYIDYRNVRATYVQDFFEHINFAFVSKAYEWALKEGFSSVSFYANELHPL